MRVEHEYRRGSSLTYIAAWDVKRAKIFGRCEDKSGIVPFNRLVNQVMAQEPCLSAKRVFSDRGQWVFTLWPTLYCSIQADVAQDCRCKSTGPLKFLCTRRKLYFYLAESRIKHCNILIM